MSYFDNTPPEIGEKSQVRVLVDPFALIITALSVSLFLNLGTFIEFEQDWTLKALLGLGFLLSGAVLSAPDQGGVGWVLDASLSQAEALNMFITGFSSFVFILSTNIAVNLYAQISITVVASVIFVQMMAIAEEWAIRAWLLNLISNLTGSDGAGILISSAIGTTAHSAIYGNREPKFMIIVFISFVLLGYIYATSTTMVEGPFREETVPCRRIASIMIGHTLVNTTAGIRARVAEISLGYVLHYATTQGNSIMIEVARYLLEVLR